MSTNTNFELFKTNATLTLSKVSPVIFLAEYIATNDSDAPLLYVIEDLVNRQKMNYRALDANNIDWSEILDQVLSVKDFSVREEVNIRDFQSVDGFHSYCKQVLKVLNYLESEKLFVIKTASGRKATESKQATGKDLLHSVISDLVEADVLLNAVSTSGKVEHSDFVSSLIKESYREVIMSYKEAVESFRESNPVVTNAVESFSKSESSDDTVAKQSTLPTVRGKSKKTSVTNESDNGETQMKEVAKVVTKKEEKKVENVKVNKPEEKDQPKKVVETDSLTDIAGQALKSSINSMIHSLMNGFITVNRQIDESLNKNDSAPQEAIDAVGLAFDTFYLISTRASKGEIDVSELMSGELFATIQTAVNNVMEAAQATEEAAIKSDLQNLEKQYTVLVERLKKLINASNDTEKSPEESSSIVSTILKSIWNTLAFIGRLLKVITLKLVDFLFNWNFDDIEKRNQKEA